MPATEPLIGQLEDVLQQGIDLLCELDDETYAEVDPALGVALGPHVRHVLDFLDGFLDGLPAAQVDYDRRDRDVRCERERAVALSRLGEVQRRLQHLPPLDQSLRVRADVPEGAPRQAGWSGSTIRRELGFLVSHTVHHYALVGLLLRARGILVEPTFGVAPSTLTYRKEAASCSPLSG